jgi:heat shock protein HslJ
MLSGKQAIRSTVSAAILLLSASCAVPPGDAPREAPAAPEPPRTPVTAADGNWEMTASSFIGAGRIPGVPRATLSFTSGSVSAYSGCNRASGSAFHRDGRLEVTELKATRRACGEPLDTFEVRYFNLLRGQPVFRRDGDTLMLLDGQHNASFRRSTADAATKP